MIRALLFDFDGLIVDTEVPTYESWRRIYEEHGVELALADWIPVVGSGTSLSGKFDAVAQLETLAATRLDREAIIARRTALKTQLCDEAPLLESVVELLAEAERLRLKTAVVTRAHRTWVTHHSERVGLAHAWAAVLCSDGDHVRPKSELYLDALRALAVEAAEAIAFEDSPAGARAAAEAGIFCVAIPNRITRDASFDGADVVLASLSARTLDDLIAKAEAKAA